MANTSTNAAAVPLDASDVVALQGQFVTNFCRFTQFWSLVVLYPIFYLFFIPHIHGRENFRQIKSPFIIVANHVAFYDSFLFRLILGLTTPHLPLRFMAVRRFNSKYLNFLAKIGIIDFVYSLFGVLTVVPGRGLEENLRESLNVIGNGGNLVIYPEGSVSCDGIIHPFRVGAAILEKRTGVPIVPVLFRVGRRSIMRKHIYVEVGKPMTFARDQSDNTITTTLHDTVIGLGGVR